MGAHATALTFHDRDDIGYLIVIQVRYCVQTLRFDFTQPSIDDATTTALLKIAAIAAAKPCDLFTIPAWSPTAAP